MKACILFVLLFLVGIQGQGSNIDVCVNDGFYQCVNPIIYDWEEPSPSAISYQNSYSNQITNLPFPVGFYGISDDFGSISFDNDLAIRLVNESTNSIVGFGVMYPGFSDSSSIQYYDIKGTAPNRRIIFTWEGVLRYGEPDRADVQLKVFENGNFETHVKNFNKISNDIFLNGFDVTTAIFSSQFFPIYGGYTGDFSQTAMGFYASPPVNNVCGNGIVEGTEDCDGDQCCTNTCTFEAATTVCRPSMGPCDIEEKCTGTTATCPTDSFLPSTTVCPEEFGVCDVKVSRTCSGNSSICSGFDIPEISKSPIHWLAYNVISFYSFTADTGSVGGRLAVKGDVGISGGFSVGHEIVISVLSSAPTVVYPANFAFLAGGNVVWTDGQLYPNEFSSIREELGLVGGSFTGAPDLTNRFLANTGAPDQIFDDAQAHYVAISNNLATEQSNVDYEEKWSGLFFTCRSPTNTRNVLNIDASVFQSATWFSVENCLFGASWVINIIGNGPMVFQGGDFPGIGEKIVFNIIGSGRIVYIDSGVNANVLAPTSTVQQNGGVTGALVIAGDITLWKSGKNPSCSDFQTFDIVLNILQPALVGSNIVEVGTFNLATAGDSFIHEGVTYTITQRVSGKENLEIGLDKALQAEIRDFVHITIDPNQPRGTDSVIYAHPENSNGSILIASIALLVIAMLI